MSILLSTLLILAIVAGVWFFDIRDLCAHNPHDPIDALALSPTYAQDRTMFIIISDQLFRSTDGGSSWQKQVKGLNHRRLLSSIALSPAFESDRTVLLSSDGDGIYISQDGGDSWTKANTGLDRLEIGLVSIHPAGSSQVTSAGYTDLPPVGLAAGANGGLFRSDNGGETWQRVMEDDIVITAIAPTPDGNLENSPLPLIIGDSQGSLYHSADLGQTWQRTWPAGNIRSPGKRSLFVHQRPQAGSTANLSELGAITAIAISPAFSTDGTFFVGTEKAGLLRTVDSGISFSEVNDGLSFDWRSRYGTLRASAGGPMLRKSEKDILSIALSPQYANDRTLYASLWNEAVFKSQDGGTTWRRYPLGLTCNAQADSDDHKSPHFRHLQVSNGYAEDHTLFLGGFDGLFQSTDRGKSWNEIQTLPSFTTGMAVCGSVPADDKRPPDKPSSIALSTAGDGVYVMRTGSVRDTGITPTKDSTELITDCCEWAIHNVGLASPDVSNIAFVTGSTAPANIEHNESPPDVVGLQDSLFSTSVIGYLYKSSPDEQSQRGADHWGRIPMSRNPSGRTASAKSLVKAVLNKLGIPKWFSAHLLGSSEGQTVSSYTLAVSPNYADDQTVFVGTRHHGLLKSVDGGHNLTSVWQPIGQTMSDGHGASDSPPASIMDLAISPDYASDGTLFASVRAAGIFKSTDRGDTWQAVNEGLSFVDIWSSTPTIHALAEKDAKLAISPDYSTDQTLFVASSRGLFKSTDGGASWQELPSSRDPLRGAYVLNAGISPDYTNDSTLMISVKGRGLFKSQDGGQTFVSVQADPIEMGDASPNEALPDRASPDTLSTGMIIVIEFSPFYGRDRTIYAASEQVAFRSLDGGETWHTLPRPVRHEDSKQVIRYTGQWAKIKGADWSGGTVSHSETATARAELDFVGTGVSWIGTQSDDQGIARIYIDGSHVADVDQYSATAKNVVTAFSVDNLPHGPHTIAVEVIGTHHPESTGSRIVIDAFDAIP